MNSNDISIARRIFSVPSRTGPWDEIVSGFRSACGQHDHQAVKSNTYRGFHRIDKTQPGAKPVFEDYFLAERDRLLLELSDIDSEAKLDAISERCRTEILARLGNVIPRHRKPYNKVRKVVDLFFEHFVAVAEEADLIRERTVEYLFLPLDSQVLKSKVTFPDKDRSTLGILEGMTYGCVVERSQYEALQSYLRNRAAELSKEFEAEVHRIYFDMVWRDRSGWTDAANLFNDRVR